MEKVIYTSQNNNLLEIAANLFSSLHAMEDDEHIKQILIEPVIEEGLGIAIMDRIKLYLNMNQLNSNVGTY